MKRIAACILAVLMIASRPVHASDGELDPTFGMGGKLSVGFGPNALTIQSNGKIVVAGSAEGNFFVARFNSDGSPDPTFGVGGKVTTDFSGSDSTFGGGDPLGDYACALAIQADGRIVVAGRAGKVGSMTSLFALARYRSDGSLDTSFGNGGKVTTDFSGYRDAAYALAIQSDGKIVAAGYSQPYGPLGAYGNGFALARYDRDGSLDTTFGIGGKIITVKGGVASALAIGPDNKILGWAVQC